MEKRAGACISLPACSLVQCRNGADTSYPKVLYSHALCTGSYQLLVSLCVARDFPPYFAQLSADSVLVLHVHTLPENEDGTGSSASRSTSYGLPPPFSWLEEKHMQV